MEWPARSGVCFRYCAVDKCNHGTTSITWSGTWRLELDSHIIKTWEEVVRVCCCERPLGMEIYYHLLSPDKVSHGDAVNDCLLLRDQVLHPVSLKQVQVEGRYHYDIVGRLNIRIIVVQQSFAGP